MAEVLLGDEQAGGGAALDAPEPNDPLDDAHVLTRRKRFLSDAGAEHDRVVKAAADYYAAYGLNAIRGRDFADLQKVWGDHPPEIGMVLSNVNTYLGALISSRREPTFPGFNMSPKDEIIGEMLTLLLSAGRRWARSDAADARALRDLVLTGYGFAEIYLETDDRPPYKPQERFVSLDRIWWDQGANESNLVDSQEFNIKHTYSVDEAASRFPDFADLIRAQGKLAGAGGEQSAPGEGARSLGGPAVSVTVQNSDGKSRPASKSRRLREIRIDDYQFKVFEEMAEVTIVDPATGQPVKSVVKMADFTAATEQAAQAAASAGQFFQEPEMTPFTQSTWYRARVLHDSPGGSPQVVKGAEPIKGNQRLVRALTGFLEEYEDGDNSLRTRFFGFGRVLLGLQRLASVWMRLSVEQEARRNRSGGEIEAGAFDSPQAKQAYVDAKAIPGSWPEVPDGALDKIRPNPDAPSPHVANISEMFNFMSVKLPAHMLGISDISRGTFEGDRSAKFLATQQETSLQMQVDFTTSFTDYLAEGAVTMARLMLELLDPPDIDRLLGNQPLREGINAEKDPASGQLAQKTDPETGQPITTGAFLKSEVGEIFEQDVSFGLRASAASERLANAQMMTQHGVLDSLQQLGVPGYLLAPAFLRASFAQGTEFADLAAQLDTYYQQQNAQQNQAAQAQTETGWVQFIQSVGRSDPQKAVQLMQQASQAMTQPPNQKIPPPAPPAGLGQ